jgi:hypothetical protein
MLIPYPMRNTLILACILIGILSCKRETSTIRCMDNSLISNIKTGSISQQQFNYNENCQLSESVEPYTYRKFTYDANNRVVKSEEANSLNPLSCYMPQGIEGENISDPRKARISSYSVFEYNSSGKLSKKSNYFISDAVQLTSYATFEYQDNRIVRLNIENPFNELTEYYLYAYDENGNLIREEYYLANSGSDGGLVSSTDFVFDSHNNPFFILSGEGEPGIYTNKNNITKETTSYYYSGSAYPYVKEYQLEYNAEGYPVKVNDLVYVYGH